MGRCHIELFYAYVDMEMIVGTVENISSQCGADTDASMNNNDHIFGYLQYKKGRRNDKQKYLGNVGPALMLA
jgi:hypothetical protein